MTAARLKATIRTALPYLAFAVVALGFLNFLWLVSETFPQQLIPSDGRVFSGHYLLWSKTNGGYVEVTRAFWEWVRFHEPTVFLSWPLVMLSGGYLVFAQLSGKMGGHTSPVVSPERVQQIRDSGPLLASTRSAGLIGRVSLSRPLMRIQVYPAGIIIKPLFMAERAILASEIGAVTPEGGLSSQSVPDGRLVLGFGVAEVSPSYRPRGPLVQIEHAGIGMASPVIILGAGNWDIAEAIRSVADAARSTSAADVVAPAQQAPMPSSSIETKAREQFGTTQGARREHLPAAIKVGLEILGIIIGVAMVWGGIAWAIPQLGPFGVAWTALALVILTANARRILVGWRE